MISKVNKEVISFLFKGELPTQDSSAISEARDIKPKDRTQTQKDEIPNLDERSAQNRQAGQTQPQQKQVVETIVRDQPKIGRNDKVTIKNVMTGESKNVKYKQAEPLLKQGTWVIYNN
jgi:preprotein translocase subunit SecA